VLWFGKGQKYQFLSYPLPPVCPIPETVLQIKHWTTGVVMSCPSFFSKSNAPNKFFILFLKGLDYQFSSIKSQLRMMHSLRTIFVFLLQFFKIKVNYLLLPSFLMTQSKSTQLKAFSDSDWVIFPKRNDICTIFF